VETRRLTTLDQAKALVDCVYETYGLTYHRDWLYDAERVLEQNARQDVLSFVATEGTRVVGHLALIRPAFELTDDGAPLTSGDTRETGLALVSPSVRRMGVQAELAMEATKWVFQSTLNYSFMKCVTHHLASQKGTKRNGGIPTGLLLGSIPRWVRYDTESLQDNEPISTLLFMVPLRPSAGALVVPEGFSWLPALCERADSPRAVLPHAPAEGETRLLTKWQGDRKLAQVHVLEVGPDLVDRLEKEVRWLLRGHILHVLVYLPADQPGVGAMGGDLRDLGLFPAGWVPRYFASGADALLYQTNAFASLRRESLLVLDDEAGMVVDRVFAGWEATRDTLANHLKGRGAPPPD
jgi:hypothetical protein